MAPSCSSSEHSPRPHSGDRGPFLSGQSNCWIGHICNTVDPIPPESSWWLAELSLVDGDQLEPGMPHRYSVGNLFQEPCHANCALSFCGVRIGSCSRRGILLSEVAVCR